MTFVGLSLSRVNDCTSKYSDISVKLYTLICRKNRKGLFFQIKDLSASSSNYILLDLSGLDEFLTHLYHFVETNTMHSLETNKCTEFLFETRTMTDNKKVFFFFSFLNLINFFK